MRAWERVPDFQKGL